MVSKLEQHIVSLLQEGDQRAIPIIYENYSSSLLGVISKITKDNAMAKDVLQESFIKIWRYQNEYGQIIYDGSSISSCRVHTIYKLPVDNRTSWNIA